MKRLLVTGASGFIGHECLRLLHGSDYEVHAVSRSGRQKGGDVRWHRVDLLSPGVPKEIATRVRASHLLHLAWTAKPGLFWEDPDNARWVSSSSDLVQAFIDAGGKRIVAAGTCAEYDWTREYCNEDTTPLAPTTAYGAAKHAFHMAMRAACEAGGVSHAWARVFWLYGPHEAAARLIPSAILSMMAGRTFVCRNPEQSLDYLHVRDVASAFVRMLDAPVDRAINVASGEAYPLRHVALTLAALLERTDLVRFESNPSAVQLRVVGRNEKLKTAGWRPVYDLGAGLQDTVHWWKTQGTS